MNNFCTGPYIGLPPVGKVDFPENACIVPGKTDEVLEYEQRLLIRRREAQREGTSSDPSLRPGHLPHGGRLLVSTVVVLSKTISPALKTTKKMFASLVTVNRRW